MIVTAAPKSQLDSFRVHLITTVIDFTRSRSHYDAQDFSHFLAGVLIILADSEPVLPLVFYPSHESDSQGKLPFVFFCAFAT